MSAPSVRDPAPKREPSGATTALAAAVAYGSGFAALGAYGPFLALLLAARGFSPGASAALLACMQLTRVASVPAWAYVADVRRDPEGVLRLVSVAAFVAFVALSLPMPPAGVAGALLVFAALRAPCFPILDAVVLRWSARTGTPFGYVRAAGTAGYTLGALGVGAALAKRGPAALLVVTAALLGLTAASTFALPRAAQDADRATARTSAGRALGLLLRRPRLRLFFATAALHQVGLAPYDGLFAAYLSRVASPTVAGLAVAFGTLAELSFMLLASRHLRAWGPARVLAVAYAGSAVRWIVLASTTSAVALVLVQGLHALTFGAFYLAGVILVEEESPAAVRASAQGLFSSFSWGLSAAGSLALAGALLPRIGLPGVFRLGALASVAALLLTAGLRVKANDAPTDALAEP